MDALGLLRQVDRVPLGARDLYRLGGEGVNEIQHRPGLRQVTGAQTGEGSGRERGRVQDQLLPDLRLHLWRHRGVDTGTAQKPTDGHGTIQRRPINVRTQVRGSLSRVSDAARRDDRGTVIGHAHHNLVRRVVVCEHVRVAPAVLQADQRRR